MHVKGIVGPAGSALGSLAGYAACLISERNASKLGVGKSQSGLDVAGVACNHNGCIE